MRVVLLGAGASKSYTESPTGVQMPLARDFFQIFFKLDIASNPWVLRDGLTYYLMHECGIADPDGYLLSGVDIEEIHSEIALKLAEVARDQSSIQRIIYSKPYIQLMFLFATTLSEIANGPVSSSHRDLAAFLRPDDIIITFNWDTLMERALMETKCWCVDDGYAVTPHSIFRDGWKNAASSLVPSAFKIIKLHGSVNWLTAYPIYEQEDLVLTHTLPVESLFVYEHATKPYSTFAGRYMAGYVPLTYGYYPPNLTGVPGRSAPEGYKVVSVRPKFPWMPEGGADESGLPSMPLIIPPVRDKSYEFFGSLFEGLWREAQEALRICEEIIIIGYSFPRTDLRSHALFTQAFMQRTSIPRVTIIDPSPERIVQKFKIDLGIPDSELHVVGSPFLGAESLLAIPLDET
jgi:SIR2-like domain